MTVEQTVFAALRSLVGDRCYPNTFAQPTGLPDWPAVRYTSSDDPVNSLCGSDNDNTDDVNVQIDVVAETFDGMKSLKRQVIAALLSTNPPCSRQPGGFETFDTETRTHRAVLQYLFQQSTAP